MKDVKILVASHKKYAMPADDFYLPIQVGAALGAPIKGFKKDNTGRNISEKNPHFCELTGLYWAWKNLDADYIGLAHYRRLFKIDRAKLDSLLEKNSVLLPKKRHYIIENLYDHYTHTLHAEPLDLTGKIIAEKYPEYYAEFERLKSRRSAHMFNMMVMDKKSFDAYCSWLFDILFMLEKSVGDMKFDDFHGRFYGRISELLLDVYLRTNHLDYAEIPVRTTERVNWLKKGSSFLLAKYFGRKYEKSF